MSTEPKPESPAELAAALKDLRRRRSGIVCGLITASLCDRLDAEQDALIDRLAAIATIQASASASQEPVADDIAEQRRRDADKARHDLLMAIYERHDIAAPFFAFDRLACGKDRDAARDALCKYDQALNMKIDNLMALSALAATQARPASGEAWQPIETAPRDSRRILVAVADGPDDRQKVREAWWRIPYEGAANEHGYWCYDGKSTMLDKSVHGIGATHWQPLPAAPTSTPSAAKKD